MAKKPDTIAPEAPPPAPPIPTSGGSYVVENGALRKIEPDATQPTPPPGGATEEE